jgi:hypothetical protein
MFRGSVLGALGCMAYGHVLFSGDHICYFNLTVRAILLYSLILL